MVAGAAALVKQKNSSLRPLQIKSAIVNTATQDITGDNGRARVTDVGAGKLNVADAVNAAAVLEPSVLSFGAIAANALPINLTLRVTNISSASATYNFAVNRRDQDSRASLRVSPAALTLSPGQQGSVTVALEGNRPDPGTYEGFIDVTGAGPALHIPFLYVVGDGVPFDIFPMSNASFIGAPNDRGWLLSFKVVDRFGVPVPNLPVRWNVLSGGGRIDLFDPQTVDVGIGAALVDLGPQTGDQIFLANVAGAELDFFGFARPLPVIGAGGVVNAGSSEVGQGLAPGSYITIFGANVAPATGIARTPYLPVSLATVSVSFDAEGLSLPGGLHFVAPGQINVQIPWEFEGRSSVEMKVSVGDLQSDVYTVPLATYSPAFFGGANAAATHADGALVEASNPARRGQPVILYANGLGPVDNTPASREVTPLEPLASTRVEASVTIGGRPAQVLFSGLTPGSIGLYQVNAIVPSDAPTGSQPVVVSIGGVDSKSANLPVQ
jgi:uncharacterized protein (TIGR03437 family)